MAILERVLKRLERSLSALCGDKANREKLETSRIALQSMAAKLRETRRVVTAKTEKLRTTLDSLATTKEKLRLTRDALSKTRSKLQLAQSALESEKKSSQATLALATKERASEKKKLEAALALVAAGQVSLKKVQGALEITRERLETSKTAIATLKTKKQVLSEQTLASEKFAGSLVFTGRGCWPRPPPFRPTSLGPTVTWRSCPAPCRRPSNCVGSSAGS
ncbi:MAG: hypothetical protein M9915_12905 [Rhizobacter sp.]|nr:hypothetical protein [Rhizobacter sp.]